MWELIALAIYSVQWLGVVLGVGAESVLLVGHLAARHERKPDWLKSIPGVATVQRWGLVFIVVSGLGAVVYQLGNDPSVLFIPTFGFKWALIALCAATFWLEEYRASAWIEGLAGAAWLALFIIHSVAPVFAWLDLAIVFAAWVAFFYALWGAALWATRMGTARPKAVPVVPAAPVPAPVPKAKVVPVPHKPVVRPQPVVHAAPAPVPAPVVVAAKPAPVVVAAKPAPAPAQVHPKGPSAWARFMAWLNRPRAPKAAPTLAAAPVVAIPTPAPIPAAPSVAPAPKPVMASVSAPIPHEVLNRQVPIAAVAPPAPQATSRNLPAIEPLELMPPKAAPAPAPAAAVVEPAYVPDWSHLPGVRIMPQKPEDLSRESRAPIVQPA